MINFLNREQVETKIKSLLEESATAQIAMAYWGEGAVNRLLKIMPPKKDVIVVCDLMSGGCNPKEIVKLQKRIGKQYVLQRDKLHAKVWLTDCGAIVGSSNASTNGVGVEGSKKTKGLVEANLFTDDLGILKELQDWFTEQVLHGASIISKEDLKRAEAAWRTRKNSGSGGQPPAPSQRPVYLVVYDAEEFSAAAMAAHNEAERKTGMRLDMYEDWPKIPAGADLIDFGVGPKSVQYTGCWQTFDPQLTSKKKNGGTVTFCRRKRGDTFGKELKKIRDWQAKVRYLFKHHRGGILRCDKPLSEMLSRYS